MENAYLGLNNHSLFYGLSGVLLLSWYQVIFI